MDYERSSLYQFTSLLYLWPVEEEAERAYQEGIARAQEFNDKRLEGSILANRAIYVAMHGHPYEGHQMAIEAEHLATEAGDPRDIFGVRNVRGFTERWIGRPVKTVELTEGLVAAPDITFSVKRLADRFFFAAMLWRRSGESRGDIDDTVWD